MPSSLGSAHLGPLGRDQGTHTEQEAMRTDAELMRLIRDQGLGGAFVFSWADEWFKRTWNTEESQVAERRQLWHDPLTNEQWFGVLATDAGEVPDGSRELVPADGPLEYVLVRADASYVHLDVTGRDATPSRPHPPRRHAAGRRAGRGARLQGGRGPGGGYGAGVRPSRAGPDPALRARADRLPRGRRRPVAPVPAADEPEPHDRRGAPRARSWATWGSWSRGPGTPDDAEYDSLASWRVDDAHQTLHLRLPWPMLGLADPSSRTALGTGRPAQLVPIEGLGLTFEVDGSRHRLDYSWKTWNSIGHTERLVSGADLLGEAFRELAPSTCRLFTRERADLSFVHA